METSGKEPQRVVQQVYALMGSCCDVRARSATQAVDRAAAAQDTPPFRPRPWASVQRPHWYRSGASLRCPVSPQVLPEMKRKQAWHSPVSPFDRYVHTAGVTWMM